MSNTIDVCQTGYDYEQFQLNELENENMKLKKKLEIATKVLKAMVGDPPTDDFSDCDTYIWAAQQALKEMEGVK